MIASLTKSVSADTIPGDAQQVSSSTSKTPCARGSRLDQALGAVADMLDALGFDADAFSASVIETEDASSNSGVVPIDHAHAGKSNGKGVEGPGPAQTDGRGGARGRKDVAGAPSLSSSSAHVVEHRGGTRHGRRAVRGCRSTRWVGSHTAGPSRKVPRRSGGRRGHRHGCEDTSWKLAPTSLRAVPFNKY